MTTQQLITALQAMGVTVRAEGGSLRVSTPRGALSVELKQQIAAQKDALLAWLERQPQVDLPTSAQGVETGQRQLSSFQERLWVLQRLDPAITTFNIVTWWPVPNGVPDEVIAETLRRIVQRHEILRSSFAEIDGVLVMQPRPAEAVPIDVRDLRHDDESTRRAIVEAAIPRQASTPFDLEAGPAVRFTCYRFSRDEALVMMAVHHIAVDHMSLRLIRQEFTRILTDGSETEPAPQYRDYAVWEHSRQRAAGYADSLAWWARHLDAAPQSSMFPPDRWGPRTGAGSSRTYRWEGDLSARLRTMTRRAGATLYMALLSACAVVLRWHAGQDDVVLGCPSGVRERVEFEPMVGPFVHLQLIRIRMDGNPSFQDLLGQVRDGMIDAHDHRSVSFEAILDRLKPIRSLDRSPLFQVAVVQHDATDADPMLTFSSGAMHELTWFVRDVAGVLESTFDYRTDLYSPEFIDLIAAHIEGVLRNAVEQSDGPISGLTALTAEERVQLAAFSPPPVERPWLPFIADFERRAAQAPDAVAAGHDGAVLTYGELSERVTRLAAVLRANGVRRGEIVGVCLDRSLELLVALLAVQKTGAAYLPLDPEFPLERLRFMLRDAGAKLLVKADELDPDLASSDLVTVDVGDAVGGAGEVSDREGWSVPSAEDPVYIIYTSGSTGRPKGVVVSHGALANLLWSMSREPGLAESDTLAAVTTVSFDIAGLELYLPLLVGARVQILSREVVVDGQALVEGLRACGASVMQATPATWRLLLEADWQPAPSFRAFCGGETLPRDLADALRARVNELWNLYGPTETTIWSTVERVDTDDVTVGRPIANTVVHIVNGDGRRVPLGVPGEIWIGGDGVANGYHDRPELTAEKFSADPFRPGGSRVYRTGDLGHWLADGRLMHLGRLDAQVKIRGFRIELGEIESALAAHDAIKQAVAAAREAAPGDLRLVVFIVYLPGRDLTVSEVRRYLRRTLPDYMVPSAVVTMDAIPLTPNGKIDRNALPNPFQGTQRTEANYEPPASPTERLLAAIWSDVLNVERVGADDNFYELGGHSLLSFRVASSVEKALGWRMDPRTLFFQTLRQIARTADALQGATVRRW